MKRTATHVVVVIVGALLAILLLLAPRAVSPLKPDAGPEEQQAGSARLPNAR